MAGVGAINTYCELLLSETKNTRGIIMAFLMSLCYWLLHVALWSYYLHRLHVVGVKDRSQGSAVVYGVMSLWCVLLIILDDSWGSDCLLWLFPVAAVRLLETWLRPGYVTDIGNRVVLITGNVT